MDGLPYPLIRAASTDISIHGIVNVRVAGMWLLGKQRRGGHDLPGLAIATLRNILFHPGFLYWMRRVRGQAFDCGDLFSRDAGNRSDARARSFAVDMYRAC